MRGGEKASLARAGEEVVRLRLERSKPDYTALVGQDEDFKF